MKSYTGVRTVDGSYVSVMVDVPDGISAAEAEHQTRERLGDALTRLVNEGAVRVNKVEIVVNGNDDRTRAARLTLEKLLTLGREQPQDEPVTAEELRLRQAFRHLQSQRDSLVEDLRKAFEERDKAVAELAALRKSFNELHRRVQRTEGDVRDGYGGATVQAEKAEAKLETYHRETDTIVQEALENERLRIEEMGRVVLNGIENDMTHGDRCDRMRTFLQHLSRRRTDRVSAGAP